MSSLLRGTGDEGEYRYSHFQASPAMLVIYLCVLLCLFGYLVGAETEAAWPPVPIHSRAHLVFWILIAMTPLMIFQLGWSYALTPMEFVVRRFGNERFRLPLSEFKGNTTVMGIVWLRFAARRVYLVSGVDGDRQTFLRELDARSRRAVGQPAAAVPKEVDGRGLSLAVDQLHFPDSCVSCGAKPAREALIEASHWFGMPMIQGVVVKAPVCDLHWRREWQVRWLAHGAVFLLGIAGAVVPAFVVEGPVSPFGVLIIGVIFGLVLDRAARLLHLRTWCGWMSLGLRTGDLTGDLLRLTIYTRSEALRRALAITQRE